MDSAVFLPQLTATHSDRYGSAQASGVDGWVSFTVCNCLTRVEADGMDEEQATTGALETDQSQRRQSDDCDGD
jgi:hypothetical protein